MQNRQNPLHQPVNPFCGLTNEQVEEYKKAVHELQLSLEQAILHVFNSAEGDRLLGLWDDHCLRQPVIVIGSSEAENNMREGRNTFIRGIRQIVNRARGIK